MRRTFALGGGERREGLRVCTYSNTAGLGDWNQEVSRRNLEPVQGDGLVRHLQRKCTVTDRLPRLCFVSIVEQKTNIGRINDR